MHLFFIHKLSLNIATLALAVFLCSLFTNSVAILFFEGDVSITPTELPEPEDSNTEKDEKKLEEDLDDKIPADIIKIHVPHTLYPVGELHRNKYFPGYLPEIHTPPPELFSFS